MSLLLLTCSRASFFSFPLFPPIAAAYAWRTPFLRLVGGWELSTIVTLQSGFPFTPQLGYNPTNSADTRNPMRRNVNPGFSGSLYTRGRTAQRAAHLIQQPFPYLPMGQSAILGDTLTGPGLAEWDLSAERHTGDGAQPL